MFKIFNIKNKQIKIAFLGDSITEFGWIYQDGYVNIILEKLKSQNYNIKPIPAGIRGQVTKELLNRLEKDVLNKKPDIVFFMGGLNDIWLGKGDISDFSKNITNIIDKTQQQNIPMIIMNLTLISDDLKSRVNQSIDEYNKALTEITKEKRVQLIDVNTEFKKAVLKLPQNHSLLEQDGVHLTAKGNSLLAETILKNIDLASFI